MYIFLLAYYFYLFKFSVSDHEPTAPTWQIVLAYIANDIVVVIIKIILVDGVRFFIIVIIFFSK